MAQIARPARSSRPKDVAGEAAAGARPLGPRHSRVHKRATCMASEAAAWQHRRHHRPDGQGAALLKYVLFFLSGGVSSPWLGLEGSGPAGLLQECRLVTPEAVLRLSGLLSALLTAGNGVACIFPSKFQQAVKVWMLSEKETTAGCPGMTKFTHQTFCLVSDPKLVWACVGCVHCPRKFKKTFWAGTSWASRPISRRTCNRASACSATCAPKTWATGLPESAFFWPKQ